MRRAALILALAVLALCAGAAWRGARAEGYELTLLWPGKWYDATGRGFQRLGREVYGTRAECEAVADRARPRLPKVRLRCDPVAP